MELVHFQPSQNFQVQVQSLFEEQKHRLLKLLPYASIEHIGATAIPGALTKGDLDILVRVPQEHFVKATETLKAHYTINQPDNWSDSFASFKDDESYSLPLGLQVVVISSPDDFFILLRDLLTVDYRLLEKYNRLKESFEGQDMDEYRRAKSQFFDRLLQECTHLTNA